jgi:hypothetical protein
VRGKATPPPKVTLPPALEALLDGIEDRMAAVKLRRIYDGIAVAMESLGYLNLLKYEPDTAEEGSADLAMWEQMAQPVADTIATVNTAIHAMRKAYPAAFDVPQGADTETEVGDWRRSGEIESVIRAVVRRLEFTLEEVRKQLRRPDVVSSRWRLLAELQDVRTGFRRQLGDLVFLSANTMAHVQREQVVPGYQSEVSHRVELRQGAAAFARGLAQQRQALLGGASNQDAAAAAREDLEAFRSAAGWKYMTAEVKRSVISVADALKQDYPPQGEQLRKLFDPCIEKLTEMVGSLAEMLDSHDREVWAECSARLGQVELHLSLGASGGKRIFIEALEAAEALSGRDTRLDGWLSTAKHLEVGKLSEAELREELGHFKEQLEVLPFH